MRKTKSPRARAAQQKPTGPTHLKTGARMGGDLFCDPNLNISTGKSEKKRANALMKALPFVKSTKDGRCFWAVKASGDYVRDYEKGEAWALQLRPLFTYNVGPNLLSWIALDMVKAGNPGEKDEGLVLGFMRGIGAQMALALAMLQARRKPKA